MSESASVEPAGAEKVGAEPTSAEAVSVEAVPVEVEGGDAACWANRVCPECGRLNGAERPEVCEVCGAEFV